MNKPINNVALDRVVNSSFLGNRLFLLKKLMINLINNTINKRIVMNKTKKLSIFKILIAPLVV